MSGSLNRRVLTEFQLAVLKALFDKGLGERGYYFTGGSALAEFYLHHRYSDDLDFFTRSTRNIRDDFVSVKEVLESEGVEVVSSDESNEFVRFFVRHVANSTQSLKMELARDAGARMSPPKIVGKIVMDSFEDIAVNKVCAVLSREPPEAKDFVDLYFILLESNFTLDYLVGRAKEKEALFDREDGVLVFATNLLGVGEFNKLPRMIKPLSLDDLQSFIIPKAEAIIRRLRPTRG